MIYSTFDTQEPYFAYDHMLKTFGLQRVLEVKWQIKPLYANLKCTVMFPVHDLRSPSQKPMR